MVISDVSFCPLGLTPFWFRAFFENELSLFFVPFSLAQVRKWHTVAVLVGTGRIPVTWGPWVLWAPCFTTHAAISAPSWCPLTGQKGSSPSDHSGAAVRFTQRAFQGTTVGLHSASHSDLSAFRREACFYRHVFQTIPFPKNLRYGERFCETKRDLVSSVWC